MDDDPILELHHRGRQHRRHQRRGRGDLPGLHRHLPRATTRPTAARSSSSRHRVTGRANDEVAARADAVRAADEKEPFAVWGGPVLTSAFADELGRAARSCASAAGGGHPECYEERGALRPRRWARSPTRCRSTWPSTSSKKLAGRSRRSSRATRPCRPGAQVRARSTSRPTRSPAELAEALRERLGDKSTSSWPSSSPSRSTRPGCRSRPTSLIAQLKTAGVTTVIFSWRPGGAGDLHTGGDRPGLLARVDPRAADPGRHRPPSPARTTRSSGRTPSGSAR